MKPTTAYLLIHNGRIVASLRERPEIELLDHPAFPNMGVANTEYFDTLKEWEAQLMEVENTIQVGENQFRIYLTETNLSPCIVPGQKANIEITGKTCRVIRLCL